MLIPVILSGGAGTRLWPVSREGHPKPFMKLPDGESLLMKTYRRARRVADPGEILTVTNREYFFLSHNEYQLSLPDEPERMLFYHLDFFFLYFFLLHYTSYHYVL